MSATKGVELQSAMQSNNAAISEKIEESNRIFKEKDVELNSAKDRLG